MKQKLLLLIALQHKMGPAKIYLFIFLKTNNRTTHPFPFLFLFVFGFEAKK